MTKLHCKQVRPLLLWTDARACESSVGGMWFAWFMRLGMEGEGTALPRISPPLKALSKAKLGPWEAHSGISGAGKIPSAFFVLCPLWGTDSNILAGRRWLPKTIEHSMNTQCDYQQQEFCKQRQPHTWVSLCYLWAVVNLLTYRRHPLQRWLLKLPQTQALQYQSPPNSCCGAKTLWASVLSSVKRE